jgi:3-deoxy-D-manno-octulosonate 8-phosphate phosphatase (KDO 8-P phosphatase)
LTPLGEPLAKPAPGESQLKTLRGLILDCDGVLTPGDLFYDTNGQRTLRFDSKDGFGLAMLCKTEVQVAVLSGRLVDIAEQRLRDVGIKLFRGECRDKAAGVRELCAAMFIEPAQCAFVGDDLPDLPAFRVVGLKIAVADAAPELHEAANWVTRNCGGRGAVREVCEAILKARGDWQRHLERWK